VYELGLFETGFVGGMVLFWCVRPFSVPFEAVMAAVLPRIVSCVCFAPGCPPFRPFCRCGVAFVSIFPLLFTNDALTLLRLLDAPPLPEPLPHAIIFLCWSWSEGFVYLLKLPCHAGPRRGLASIPEV